MTNREVDEIVLISSEQATKTDFYERMKPAGCPIFEYQKALLASYERLEKYLNETDPFHFRIVINETGEIKDEEDMSPEFYQESYWSNLDHFHEIGIVSTPYKRKIRIWDKISGNLVGTYELLDLYKSKSELYTYCSEILGSDRPKGFKTKLEEGQIDALYEKMNGRFIEASIKNFRAILTDKTVPPEFEKVKWILKHGKHPIKTTLREFLEYIIVKPKPPLVKGDKRIISLICDGDDEKIEIANPQKEHSQSFFEIEKWINEITEVKSNKKN